VFDLTITAQQRNVLLNYVDVLQGILEKTW